jgi:hypothetical protein
MDRLVSPEDQADVIEQLFLSARRLAPTFRSAHHLQTIELVRKIVYRVVIDPDKVEVLLRKQNLRHLLGQKSSSAVTDLIRLVIHARLGRRGVLWLHAYRVCSSRESRWQELHQSQNQH